MAPADQLSEGQNAVTDESREETVSEPTPGTGTIRDQGGAAHCPGTRRTYRLTVEPAIFLFLAAMSVSGTVTQMLFLQRVCEQDLNRNASECSILNTTDRTLEQPHAAGLLVDKTLLEALLPAATSLFIGPWSDRHGRKPLLLFPMLGYAMMYALYAWLSTAENLPPRYLVAASVPVAVTGGFIAVILSSFSYIADVTPPDKRGFRIGLVDASVSLSSILGNAVYAPLYRAAGFVGVFVTASCLCLLGFLYVLLLLPESVQPPDPASENANRESSCKVLQDTVGGVFKTSFVWRPNYGRAIVLLCAASLGLIVFILVGEINMVYMFTNRKFGWSAEDYAELSIVALSLSAFSSVGFLYLFVNVLHIAEPIVAVFGFVFKLAASVLAAVSPYSWFLYLASLVSACGSMAGSLVRSIMSKSVPPDEVGSVFSLTAFLEALTPLVASPLYTAVYDASITTLPGAFYFLSAAFYLLDAAFLLVVACLRHKSATSITYVQLPEEIDNGECSGTVDS